MCPSLYNCRRTFTIIALVVALAVAVAIAVAVHSSVAAPQSDGDAITIDGQQCKCVPFNMCLPNNTVNVPSSAGSCSSNKVCCINEYVNNNILGCGIGMSPPNTINISDSIIGPRILSFEEILTDNSNTYFGQFPWMVAIIYTDINEVTGITTKSVFICGGSLIHPRVVLTAAHCVSNKDVKLIQVRVGMWDTQCPNNEENGENSCEDFDVSKIVYHPNYYLEGNTIRNDVALVELESAIILKPHINIICIPDNENQTNYDPQSCVSTGWGQNGHGQYKLFNNNVITVNYETTREDIITCFIPYGKKPRKIDLHKCIALMINYYNIHVQGVDLPCTVVHVLRVYINHYNHYLLPLNEL